MDIFGGVYKPTKGKLSIKEENVSLISELSAGISENLTGYDNIILKRKGYKPSLMIGVQKDKREFKSHAWVKLSEKEFFLSPDEEYKRIMEIT